MKNCAQKIALEAAWIAADRLVQWGDLDLTAQTKAKAAELVAAVKVEIDKLVPKPPA